MGLLDSASLRSVDPVETSHQLGTQIKLADLSSDHLRPQAKGSIYYI